MLRCALATLIMCAAIQGAGLRAVNAATCNMATSAAIHALCWFDLSAYVPTNGSGLSITSGGPTPLSFTLPDGSTLSLTMTTTFPSPTNISQSHTAALPTWAQGALGGEAYLGVSGKPAIYSLAGTPVITQLSNITLKNAAGIASPTATIAGADAESTDFGDGGSAYIAWATSGPLLSQLQLVKSISNLSSPVCTLSGVGTSSANCAAYGSDPVAAYILDAILTPSDTFTMSAHSTSHQSYAFAVDVAQLTAVKTLNGRSNASDQFAVKISHGATTLATAATSGTGTTATTALGVIPGDTFTLTDAAAGGSSPNFSNYVSSYACANAVSSATTLPSGSGTSLSITPALDDQITCTFTNDALTLTNTPSAAQSVSVPATVIDTFTLTNTSVIPASFAIGAIAVTGSSTGAITPSGYVFGGTTYPTLTAARNAVTTAGSVAANASITFGVQYAAPATPQTISTSLAATDSSGSSSSAAVSATETDSMGTGLAIAKSGTTATAAGGIIAWTILATNNGPSASNSAAFSDPVPAGLLIAGTPSCGSATGGAVCGTVGVSGNLVTSTIATFPAFSSVSFFIHAVAGSASTYTNTATLTPTSGAAPTSSLTTAVSQTNGLNETVRNITKGESTGHITDTASPGDTLEFGLSFTNTTATALQNFAFSDALPANVTFASATCGTIPAGITSCTPATPAVGGSGTVTFAFAGSFAAGNTLSATIRVLVI